ncbi:MAG: hypothetical protein LBO03_00590, partial [Acidaminococcales bacterium]|nr:hypothetical protein [Acidaminococcales bacterium]
MTTSGTFTAPASGTYKVTCIGGGGARGHGKGDTSAAYGGGKGGTTSFGSYLSAEGGDGGGCGSAA